jgi:hypothetical protein
MDQEMCSAVPMPKRYLQRVRCGADAEKVWLTRIDYYDGQGGSRDV